MTTIRPFTFDVRGALFVIAVLTLLSPAHAWETHSGAHDEAGVTSEPRRWIGRASLGATYLEASTDVFASRGVGVAMGGDITTRIAREVYAGGALAFGTTLATTRAGSVAALEHAELRAYSLGPTLSYYLAGDRGLRAQAFVGVLGFSALVDDGDATIDWGPSLAGTVGYDFALGQTTTVGVELRTAWANVWSLDDLVAVVAPSLAVTGMFGIGDRR